MIVPAASTAFPISCHIYSLSKSIYLCGMINCNRHGIATSTISDWRKKKINPQADKLVAICKALDMSLINLLCDEDYREQQTVSTEFSIDENYMLEMFQLSQMLKGKALW